MATPVMASVGADTVGSGSSLTPNAPAGVSVGDWLDLFVGINGAQTATTPTGWDLAIPAVVDADGSTRSYRFIRKADGGANDTPTVTLSGSVAYRSWMMRITGADGTDPLDLAACASASYRNLSTYPIPSITTSGTDRLLIATGICSAGAMGVLTPAGWTNVEFFNGGVSYAASVVRQDAPTAGAYGGGGFTTGDPTSDATTTILAWTSDGGGEPPDDSRHRNKYSRFTRHRQRPRPLLLPKPRRRIFGVHADLVEYHYWR